MPIVAPQRWRPNYTFQIKSITQTTGRLAYIKSLRAIALYLEEEVTDEDFFKIAMGEKPMPDISTYSTPGVSESNPIEGPRRSKS